MTDLRKKTKVICFIFTLIIASLFILPLMRVFAEFTIVWDKTWGGTEWDRASSVVVASDGGYAITGYTSSFGEGGDAWLIKTDANGNMEWNQTYGGVNFDAPMSLVFTSDGGYAIAGFTGSTVISGAGDNDFWLVKTDADGNLEWDQTYGGTGDDRAYGLVVASDGGYVLAGQTNSFGSGDYDCWLVKTDSSGVLEWSQTYGGAEYEYGMSLVAASDGGYAIAGETGSFGAGGDFWLVKTDSSGNMEWSQNYGGTYYERAKSLIVTSDGGFAIAGSTAVSQENVDFGLVKTDASGNVVWQKTYGETAGDYGISEDSAYSVIQTGDGGYVLAGFAGPSAAGDCDAWLVKTDADGNMEWNQTYGDSGNDQTHCVVQTSDGGYVLAAEKCKVGTEDYDFWLIKIGAEAEEEDGEEPPPAGALPMEFVYVGVAAVVIAVVVVGIVAYRKRK